MNVRKVFSAAAASFALAFSLSAANDISLLDNSKKTGVNVYWDSLSESGMLEKNDHHLSFRTGEEVVILDGIRMMITDAPELNGNRILVSKKFLDDSEEFFSQKSELPFKVGAILIDAGHGGKDPGALKTYRVGGKDLTIREKDITLRVAKMLGEKLRAAYPNKQIILTRDKDVFLSLGERTDIANGVKVGENEAVLFISVHVNSSLNKNSSGYEVWYLSPGYRRTVLDKASMDDDKSLFPILNSMMEEEYTTESIMIAKFIMDGLQGQIGKESTARGIKAEEWFVVKNSNMPSVLIELGFVSNEKEALLLNDEKYLKKATLGIYNGIAAFITHFERSQGFTSLR
ncbi:MAG: N-acetylmuramoyl-L-alanine amidase [Treponema sp.]|nr:N-acetylmuramoyl-L-alanine amidase [Treponema sp.]